MRLTASVKRPQKQIVAQPVPLPAPVGGWDAISPLANMPVDRAIQIDNWVARPGWIEPRKGYVVQSTGLGTTAVSTVMAYNSIDGTRNLFGACGTTIWDCSTAGAAVATSATTLSDPFLQYVLFSNPNTTTYLIAVNGIDNPWLYDGTSWTQPAINIGNAYGSVAFGENPINTETLTLGGTVVTFVTGTPSGNQVQIGIDLPTTLTSLVTFLNTSSDVNIIKCSYNQVFQNTLQITYKTSGYEGNTFTIAESNSSAVLSGSTLSGGSQDYGITANDFITVNSYMNRLWFVPVNSTNVVFLTNVGAVQGPASVFPLGQLLKKGGYIQAVGTWTVDTRQNVDEYIAFISSRGEVIVYQGTDPTTANTWTLAGIYQVGAPIGRRCFLRIAGDLQIITVDGVMGMSEMLSTDRAAANRVSLTSVIMNQINQAAQSYSTNRGWQLVEYPIGTLAILNIPYVENSYSFQYVMNTITGAWTRFIGLNQSGNQDLVNYGLNAICWEVDAYDNIYFGSNNGTVCQWNVSSSDNGTPITCIVQSAYNSFGNAAQLKRYTMLQPLITTTGFPIPSTGINVDFNQTDILSTPQPLVNPNSYWNVAVWDVDFFWAGSQSTTNSWTSIQGLGHYVSIVTQVTTTSSSTDPALNPIVQLNGWNILAESGAFV